MSTQMALFLGVCILRASGMSQTQAQEEAIELAYELEVRFGLAMGQTSAARAHGKTAYEEKAKRAGRAKQDEGSKSTARKS